MALSEKATAAIADFDDKITKAQAISEARGSIVAAKTLAEYADAVQGKIPIVIAGKPNMAPFIVDAVAFSAFLASQADAIVDAVAVVPPKEVVPDVIG